MKHQLNFPVGSLSGYSKNDKRIYYNVNSNQYSRKYNAPTAPQAADFIAAQQLTSKIADYWRQLSNVNKNLWAAKLEDWRVHGVPGLPYSVWEFFYKVNYFHVMKEGEPQIIPPVYDPPMFVYTCKAERYSDQAWTLKLTFDINLMSSETFSCVIWKTKQFEYMPMRFNRNDFKLIKGVSADSITYIEPTDPNPFSKDFSFDLSENYIPGNYIYIQIMINSPLFWGYDKKRFLCQITEIP